MDDTLKVLLHSPWSLQCSGDRAGRGARPLNKLPTIIAGCVLYFRHGYGVFHMRRKFVKAVQFGKDSDFFQVGFLTPHNTIASIQSSGLARSQSERDEGEDPTADDTPLKVLLLCVYHALSTRSG